MPKWTIGMVTVREGITTVYWRYLGLACRTQVSSLRESCEEECSHGQFKFQLKMQVLHVHYDSHSSQFPTRNPAIAERPRNEFVQLICSGVAYSLNHAILHTC